MREGNSLDGTYDMIFSIYPSDPNSGPLWTETHTSVDVSNGTVNVLLGSKKNLDDQPKVTFDEERYLGITIDCDHDPNTKEEEMTPRQRILPVLYSFNADRLDGRDSSEFTTPQTDAGRPGVVEHLYEGNTRLVDKYLDKGAQALDADKLDGYHATTSGSDENAIPVINSGTTYNNLRSGYASSAGSAGTCNSCTSASSCSSCTEASRINGLRFGPYRLCSWSNHPAAPGAVMTVLFPYNWSSGVCKNMVCGFGWRGWELWEIDSGGGHRRIDGGGC
ncbi:MAG: hypothetical protein ACMUHX_09370 [bacterium]